VHKPSFKGAKLINFRAPPQVSGIGSKWLTLLQKAMQFIISGFNACRPVVQSAKEPADAC
jgi:hypothetical protein